MAILLLRPMRNFFGCFLGALIGLIVAVLFVPGVQVIGDFYKTLVILLTATVVLGLFNFILAPLIKLIAFPLKFLTLGLLGLIIEILFIEIIDIIFTPEITITGFLPLFWCGIIIWISTSIFARKQIWSKDD